LAIGTVIAGGVVAGIRIARPDVFGGGRSGLLPEEAVEAGLE
jgi:hypothetical protein